MKHLFYFYFSVVMLMVFFIVPFSGSAAFHFEQMEKKGAEAVLAPATQLVHVSTSTDYVYTRPKPFRFLISIPKDIVHVYQRSFRKENIPVIGMILAETALMVPADQGIIDGAKSAGHT